MAYKLPLPNLKPRSSSSILLPTQLLLGSRMMTKSGRAHMLFSRTVTKARQPWKIFIIT